MHSRLPVHLIALLGLFLAVGGAFAQNALEATRGIQTQAEESAARFRAALVAAKGNPALLDSIAASAEIGRGELEVLNQEVDSQLDFLSKKEAGISSSGLAESDRKELLAELSAQKKPLAAIRTSSSAWAKIFTDFPSVVLPEWKNLHSSFAEIAGEDKARQKLSERIEAYILKLPGARSAEKPSSSQGSRKSEPAKNNAVVAAQAVADPLKMGTVELRAAAKNGNAAAQCELARRYRSGTGVPRDTDQAFYWYTRAAEKGNSDAQFYLGMMYRDGEGVSMDYQLSRKWLSKAASSGNQYAKSVLAGMR